MEIYKEYLNPMIERKSYDWKYGASYNALWSSISIFQNPTNLQGFVPVAAPHNQAK